MSFQSMMDGNNGYSQPSGYSNPAPQRNFVAPSHSNPWASPVPQSPASPAYGTEFAHTHTHDADPFVAASSLIAIDIETISLSYREIRDAVTDINTPKDTVEFRNNLRKKIDDTNALGRKIQSSIRQLGSISHGSMQERKANKAKVDKMDASFAKFYSSDYQTCVRQAEEQMRRYTPRTASSFPQPSDSNPFGQVTQHQGHYYATRDEDEEQASLIEAQRQQEYSQLSSDVEAQNSMIQYRDQAIRSLQRDMSEVHDMFKDLANLVSEQGHMVDDIESNVDSAGRDIESAHEAVTEANRSQQKGRSKLCIIAVVITIIVALAVLITVVVVMTKKK